MIAIKEMNMPERCEECKFCLRQKTNDYGSFGECLLQKNKRVNCLVRNRDDNCPLVEIGTCKDCKSIKVLDKEPCEDAASREVEKQCLRLRAIHVLIWIIMKIQKRFVMK